MRRRIFLRALGLVAGLSVTGSAHAGKTLQDYRYFRALSLDLQGRIPTRDEVAQLEADDFDVDAFIDQRLTGPAYAERVRRIYMDLLRLEVGSSFQFVPSATVLRLVTIQGPDGNPLKIYFRQGQRRTNPDTDAEFCLTQAQTGLQFPHFAAPTGTAKSVSQADLDAATIVVKPWWLYRDYASASPSKLYGADWTAADYGLVDDLVTEKDAMGKPTTPITQVRVCREEAALPASGTIYTSGRTKTPTGTPLNGRLTQPPVDSSWATMNTGQPVSCDNGVAFSWSADCGCGKALERCMPTRDQSFEGTAFLFPQNAPLGPDAPMDETAQGQSSWQRFWWSQEAKHFIDGILSDDRDFREVLTSPATYVNGPLTQFYQHVAPVTCCGNGVYFGQTAPTPLFDPSSLPTDLLPHDASSWERVENRGPLASGILTMPVFLTKYGSRRARAHVLYNAFLCRDFIAENVSLPPSTEPNLMIREGCSACHATLEPMAAHFARIVESDWTYLPPDQFPQLSPTCAPSKSGTIPGQCKNYYDPAFTDATGGKLRGSYASMDNVESGPAGLAASLASTDEFASCVAQNVASSFLGRPMGPQDLAYTTSLAKTFTDGGFHMRAMVAALVRSDAYKKSNDLSSSALRGGGQ